MRSGRASARCAPAPQGLPCAQGGLQPAAPQPRRGFHALREGFSPLRPSPAGASMRSGRASARCIPAPQQGLPCAQGGLQPAAPQPRRGFHALREGFSPLRPSPAGASMRSGRASARTSGVTPDDRRWQMSSLTDRRLSVAARRGVDRNSFRSPCEGCDSGSVQPCSTGSTFVRTPNRLLSAPAASLR
jgi:hypothetical protein